MRLIAPFLPVVAGSGFKTTRSCAFRWRSSDGTATPFLSLWAETWLLFTPLRVSVALGMGCRCSWRGSTLGAPLLLDGKVRWIFFVDRISKRATPPLGTHAIPALVVVAPGTMCRPDCWTCVKPLVATGRKCAVLVVSEGVGKLFDASSVGFELQAFGVEGVGLWGSS